MKTKLFTLHHAIYTVVFLLMIASFVPVSSHMICGGCPWDGNDYWNKRAGIQGENGQCEYCETNHSNHIYEPPPTTQAECDEARKACEKAQDTADAAWKQASLICAVALIEPSPAGEVACYVFTVRAMAETTYATYICEQAEDICSRVDSTFIGSGSSCPACARVSGLCSDCTDALENN